MTEHRQQAERLLAEWKLYRNARSKGRAVDLQIDRDQLDKLADHLQYNMLWSEDPNELVECCYQFENQLRSYKDRVIIDILQHGTV